MAYVSESGKGMVDMRLSGDQSAFLMRTEENAIFLSQHQTKKNTRGHFQQLGKLTGNLLRSKLPHVFITNQMKVERKSDTKKKRSNPCL